MSIAAIPAWLEFDDGDKPYVEHIRGRRERKVSPRRIHAMLHWRIAAALDGWARGRGEVGTEWRCFLIEGDEKPSSLLADVSYYSFERLPRELGEDARERPRIAPDIAVEIVSPRESRRKPEEKIDLFLRHGATVVAVLDPRDGSLALHGRGKVTSLHARGRLRLAPYDDLILDFDDIFRGI